MIEPWWLDHAMALALALVLPVEAVRSFRKLRLAVASGDAEARSRGYKETMRWEWSFVLALLAAWWWSGRSPELLGLGFGLDAGWRLGLAWALTAAGVTALLRQAKVVRESSRAREQVRAQIEPVSFMLPRTDREARLFVGLSVTAGVCEEILYRGFLIAYLTPATGVAGAALGSSLIFGLGHAYQGLGGILKTGTVGLLAAGLYLLSGSLWPPIVLHVAVDAINGSIGRLAVLEAEAGEPV